MSTFTPKFTITDSLEKCADMINRPHEDYPKRVDVTLAVMQDMIEWDSRKITEHDCKAIHSHVMWDIEISQRGCWRNRDVTIGFDMGVAPHLIQTEIDEQKLFPVYIIDSELLSLIDWYRRFQIIHPFYDGNGRVGGIIVAVASYRLYKKHFPHHDFVIAPYRKVW